MHSGFESPPPSHHLLVVDVKRWTHGHAAEEPPQELVEHPLVASLRPEEQQAVAAICEFVDVPAGTLLLAQGAVATGLHLLLSGQVEVVVQVADRRHDVAVLGPGSVIGELSLLEGEERSAADVRALTDVRAARIAPEHDRELLAIDAVALQLDATARRRRATNRALRVPPVEAGTVDGRTLQLRPLWPEDWRQLAAGSGSGRVSEESLRMRFFQQPPMTERTFRRLTLTDHGAQFAWGAFVGDELIGIGRYALQAEDRRAAEMAVLVADDAQRKGVASRLIVAIAAAADAHGATELYALARAENEAVRGLLERYGASWTEGDEAGTIEARWPIAEVLRTSRDEVLEAGAHAAAAAVLGDVLDR